ncbi:MAG: hypothetical protein DCF28_14585 [Alphaproteobacteria bacterium]|nr:MAG: hypothetical protein DCF28_14585 [Alphaproteobacteria bacterium]
MNMMHDWGRPIDRRRISPFQPTEPRNKLTTDFRLRLEALPSSVNRPPYAHEVLLPFTDAAWFLENPVNAMRINLTARPQQRIQFFAGAAILMRPNLEGLTLTSAGVDGLGRASIVTPVEPVWGNLIRIARWLASQRS